MKVAFDTEITASMRCLQGEREHVLGAVEGLSDEALRRPVLPSGWSCIGMVQHLALSVERLYFRAVVAGDPEVIEQVGSRTKAWQVDPGLPAADVLDRYSREASLADAVTAASSGCTARRFHPAGRVARDSEALRKAHSRAAESAVLPMSAHSPRVVEKRYGPDVVAMERPRTPGARPDTVVC